MRNVKRDKRCTPRTRNNINTDCQTSFQVVCVSGFLLHFLLDTDDTDADVVHGKSANETSSSDNQHHLEVANGFHVAHGKTNPTPVAKLAQSHYQFQIRNTPKKKKTANTHF